MPQQQIPLEASKTLAFTPASLAEIEDAPVFTLRTATWREKDAQRELQRELRLKSYSTPEIRAEILAGLKDGWTDEAYGQLAPLLQEWWGKLDDYNAQRKSNPDLSWTFDPAVEALLNDHVEKIEESWPLLARMQAANERFIEKSFMITIAVMVKDFAGLDAKRQLEAGHLTMECVTEMLEALRDFEQKHHAEHGLIVGAAMYELYNACNGRFRLDEEEAKNSASPSPSEETRSASNGTDLQAAAGTSKASGSSKKTRQDA